MPNLSAGSLSVTALRIKTTATARAVVAAMSNRAPSHSGFKSGWGSTDDDPVPLADKWGVGPTAGTPSMKPAHREAPEHGTGRLYWFEYSERRAADRGLPARHVDAWALCGADVVLSPSDVTGNLTVFVTSRSDDDLRSVIEPALLAAIQSVDSTAQLAVDKNDLYIGDVDFFLWLLSRVGAKHAITTRLSLDGIRVIESQDSQFHSTSLSEGVDMTRYELLTLISMVGADFGPVKVKIHDGSLLANYDFELFVDGEFTITLGETHISTIVTRADKGYAAFLDLAYFIIPELKSAYEGDNDWRVHGGREEFLRRCRDHLAGPRLGLEIPVSDVSASKSFYNSTLHFGFNPALPSAQEVDLTRDAVRLTITQSGPGLVVPPHQVINLHLSDAAELLDQLVTAGFPVSRSTTVSSPDIDFIVKDPDGYQLRIRSITGF